MRPCEHPVATTLEPFTFHREVSSRNLAKSFLIVIEQIGSGN